ncbi:hypothetical protein [Neorhizobium sp. P12A]|uniref:hypothetical protein n=1 Tax=Neorhizobium sp. P12A TaxID=2268027 RepID=UPI0011EDE440|nr:hypothetical protein [Neorhizobium sp. P12A]
MRKFFWDDEDFLRGAAVGMLKSGQIVAETQPMEELAGCHPGQIGCVDDVASGSGISLRRSGG